MSYFQQAYAIIVSPKIEGGFSDEPTDAGNWTGGKVGAGSCNGTKHGISAASYPSLDIVNLTDAQIEALYLRDYWNALQCDALPWDLALVVFDCGVNQGVSAAKGIRSNPLVHTTEDFLAERGVRYARADAFGRDGRGWLRRLFNIHKLAQVPPP